MKANKKETDPWAWAKAWTSKTQKKKEAAGKNLKRSEILLESIKLCSLGSDFNQLWIRRKIFRQAPENRSFFCYF